MLLQCAVIMDKMAHSLLNNSTLRLGDIEIMHCDYCSKSLCDYCYIALKHFAVVNKAEHHPTSVS